MEAVAEEKDLYREGFESFQAGRRGEPPWVLRARREAIERFSDLGFPTVKNEEWKYTSVAPIARVPFRRANGALPAAGSLPADVSLRAPHQIVFINGRFAADLSSASAAAQGVEVRSLKEILSAHPEWLEPYLTRIAGDESNPFTALNTAFLEDGAFVRLRKGAVLQEPIHLVFLSEPSSEPTVSYPRNLILAESGSQGTIVETYIGTAGELYFTNTVTEIALEEGAVLDHYKVQRESEAAFHVATLEVRQGRSSSFTSHNLSLGGGLTRNDINVLLDAPGGDCVLNGLFVGNGTQHVDNHTKIDHAKPHCTSRELYKGIMDGKSRGIFNGKIIVRPDAQKTDAMQTNKNLLLSREALVNSTPALEIRADDVKCRHGSTIGQLDESAMFYLRSRGLGEGQARALLIYAFAADISNRIKVAPIREGIERFLGLTLPVLAGDLSVPRAPWGTALFQETS